MSFQGSLTDLPLADIVQLVAVSGKTGMFSLSRAAESGAVYLSSGQIVHARLGEVEGEDAVYSLALWTSGSFQFSPGVESDKQTITRSNTNLLMEAARRSDEWKILSKKIPSTEAVPRLMASDRHSGPITLTPQEWAVITRCDGRATIEGIALPEGRRIDCGDAASEPSADLTIHGFGSRLGLAPGCLKRQL